MRPSLGSALDAALLLLAVSPAHAGPREDADRAAILDTETRWNAAVAARDAAAVEPILSPDFILITPDGGLHRRADVLRMTGDKSVRVDPFVTRDVEIRLHGDSAVVTGWFAQTGAGASGPFNVVFRYTDVWRREGDRWIAVSAHASRLAAPPTS